MPKANQRRASDDGYVDFGKQQEIYEALTGDRESFIGFDSRFAAWAKEHPRDQLQRGSKD